MKMSILKRFLILLLVFMAFPAQAQRTADIDLSTDTHSSTFATAEERVEFLNRYLDFPSPPKDAQFTLIYFDNLQGFPPGPSDWDMRMVVWLEPRRCGRSTFAG